MSDDEFKPIDINAIRHRVQAKDAQRRMVSGERELTVMEMQQLGRERRSARKADAARLVEGADSTGKPCWLLHGQPVRDGQVMEVYTNRANGFVRGQVMVGAHPERPRLLITLWDAWGKRDVDGLPPRVGTWELPIVEGAMCRFTGALPQEID